LLAQFLDGGGKSLGVFLGIESSDTHEEILNFRFAYLQMKESIYRGNQKEVVITEDIFEETQLLALKLAEQYLLGDAFPPRTNKE